SGCDVASPADLPKVFAVNGMPTTTTGCDTNYNSCTVNSGASASGGATITTPDLAAHPGALSVIALAAPTALEYTTVETGDNGEVDDSALIFRAGGSSMATAYVAGLAANVKSLYLKNGATWINSPGRLQTVMLTMSDRHFDATSTQRTTGSNNDWGFG